MRRSPARISLAIFLVTACSGGHAPKTTPEPRSRPNRAAAPAHAAPPASAEIAELPPAPELDSTIPVEELTAELRIAADSAADEAVLEALAEAAPTTEELDSITEADLPSEATKALANAVTWDIDVASFNSHNRVQYYLDFFRGPARERFGIWLTRMPRYEGMIRDRLQKEGLPADLVYLALIESGFSNTASSRARAVGMWQFMKGTAKLYGLRVDSWVDERRDPYRATDAAARHLRDLTSRFGSVYLAAAAYNAGAGKVSRGLGRLPDDDADSVNTDATFFRLYDTKLLRRETKDYVPKLIAAALIAKEPRRYGFDVGPADPAAYDSLIVPDMTGLDVIARLADTTVAAVREMNPQYLRLATPPGVRSVVRIPAGRGETTVAGYAALPASRRVTFVEYFVKPGDTMGGIASRYHVSLRLLTDANPRVRGRALRVGRQIIVPTGGALSSSVARRVSDPKVPAASTASGFHRVRRGETLTGLAAEYDVTVSQLRKWNALGESESIRAGQRLRISAPGRQATPAPVPSELKISSAGAQSPSPSSRVHVVRKGETLGGLARQYGVSVQALREANGLSERDPIRAGFALKIPG
jgi:membrane-bound lytic murein transglycosylase D